jgi:hypothetical protein
MTIPYNTDRGLDTFQKQIDTLRQHGFNPIAVAHISGDSFVFETEEEANKAHDELHCDTQVLQGCWYSKDEFLATVKEYEKEGNYTPRFMAKVRTYWLVEPYISEYGG